MRFFAPVAIAFAAIASASGRALSSLESRSLIDVCAEVNADVGILAPLLGAELDLCLCLSAIPDLLLDARLVAAVQILGAPVVTALLTALVDAAPGKQTCTFPDHSVPLCVASNPCGFGCADGFIPCNGICVPAGQCPSPKPKRDLEIRSTAHCSHGYTACGVDGWSGMRSSQAWECVDIESDIESCGGCAIPLNPFTPRGIDCTTIPGISDVSCNAGSCVVHRCLPGYVPSLDRSFCLRKTGSTKFIDDEAAMAYGLEHMPFKN